MKHLEKITRLIIAVILVAGLAACNKDDDTKATEPPAPTTKINVEISDLQTANETCYQQNKTANTRAKHNDGLAKKAFEPGDIIHLAISVDIPETQEVEDELFTATMNDEGAWITNKPFLLPELDNNSFVVIAFYDKKRDTSLLTKEQYSKAFENALFGETDPTTGITTYPDLLLARGINIEGKWNNKEGISLTAEGTLNIALHHESSLVTVSTIDNSMGSEVRDLTLHLAYNDEQQDIKLTPTATTLEAIIPCYYTLKHFTATLEDGRRVNIDMPKDLMQGEDVRILCSHSYTMRITLNPTASYATIDNSHPDPNTPPDHDHHVWINADDEPARIAEIMLKTHYNETFATDGTLTTNIAKALALVAPNGKKVNLTMTEIKEIPIKAFEGCTALVTINLPKVETIGDFAFANCTALALASLPRAHTIGECAFQRCTNLQKIDMPETTELGHSSFLGCKALTTVNMPLVKRIEKFTFADCSSLNNVDIAAAKYIDNSSFRKCSSLTTINLPVADTIGVMAFSECTSLVNVAMPMVKIIAGGAFDKCTALTNINLPAAEKIGMIAFFKCTALTTVSLPAVTYIDDGMIEGCSALSRLEMTQSTQTITVYPEAFIKTDTSRMTLVLHSPQALPTIGVTVAPDGKSVTFANGETIQVAAVEFLNQ